MMTADDLRDLSADMLGQLRGALDHLNTIAARVPGVAQAAAHIPSVPTFPAPGKITAAQISAVVGAVRAQRSSIQSMRISLDAYEQQLDVLERLLEPFESVSQAWARIEGSITGARGEAGSEQARPGDAAD